MKKKLSLGLATALAFMGPSIARASNVLEFPDNGSEQMARGGAWTARASDPLATYFNPAGLAGQRTALTLQANVSFQHTCFSRIKAAGDTTADYVAPGGSYPRVCNDIGASPNPQIAGVYRINDRVGIGLAILAPSAVGDGKWPSFVGTPDESKNAQAAPQRYLLVEGHAFQLNPTIGVGAEIIDNLRLGVAFSWGIFKAKLNNAGVVNNIDNGTPRDNDLAATAIASDYFVPSVTFGGMYTVNDQFDIAGTFKWTDSIKASGNLYTQANYFTQRVHDGDKSGIKDTDTSYSNCNQGAAVEGVCGPDQAKIKLSQPMEAKLAFRYHKPRTSVPQAHQRDPINTDVFDAEVDFTWANNSAIDALQIRFPGDAGGNGIIPVNGTPGTLPPIADVPRDYKDVFGVRAGGDYNVIPGRFALRGGMFFESNGQNVKYQNIDFVGSARLGLSTGATLRLDVGHGEKKDSLEFMLGFMHVFYQKQQNDDPNGDGIHAPAGTPCNPTENPTPAGNICGSGRQKYQTNWPINLGSITSALNVINVGATYRF